MNGPQDRGFCTEMMSGDGTIPSSLSIALSSALPLSKQIAEVNRLLSGWLAQMKEPFDDRVEGIFLTECRSEGDQKIYCYEILEKYPN